MEKEETPQSQVIKMRYDSRFQKILQKERELEDNLKQTTLKKPIEIQVDLNDIVSKGKKEELDSQQSIKTME